MKINSIRSTYGLRERLTGMSLVSVIENYGSPILCEKLSTNKLLWDAPLAMELTRVEFEKMEKWVRLF
jgi:hypothetical protein